MTQTQPPMTAQLGQAVGEARQALSRLQAGVLAEEGTDFETWVTLNTIATRRASLNADPVLLELASVTAAVAEGIGAPAEQIEALVQRLIGDGVVEERDGQIVLSDAGQDLHSRVRAGGAASTNRLIDRLEVAEVERTVATLRELTARAHEMLADSAAPR